MEMAAQAHKNMAITFHGKCELRYEEIPMPRIEEPTDAIVKVTLTVRLPGRCPHARAPS